MQCEGAAMASLGCTRAASLAAAFTTARRAGSRSKADHREGGRMFARVAGGIGLGVLVLGMEDIGKTDVMQSKSAAMCHSELPTTRTVEVVSVQNHTKDVNPLNSTSKRRMRVLITGFHDWRHEEDTLDAPNEENDEKKNTTDVENTRSVQNVQRTLWRCKDNPSCRLLYGAACATPPIERSGPLVRALADEELEADFVFQSLPVIWNTSFGLDLLAFDVVVHMGLGVYDSDSTLMLESGAFNCRRGTDVIGAERAEHIDGLDGQAAELRTAVMDARVASMHGRQFGPFQLVVAEAREANAYICNETHWRALKAHAAAAVETSDSRLRAVYFVHLPYARDDSHEELGRGVAKLIAELLRAENTPVGTAAASDQ